ncbi:MAG TPA: hypothetical protein VMV69_01290 [Pirellulales bacterium]|nr:hypothetical protein [Pirellulales bacterium]
MEFHDYSTTHDVAKRLGLTDKPADRFYHEMQALAIAAHRHGVPGTASEFNRYQSELNWYTIGRPYYKLWPAVIPLLAGVGIDVPVEYLRAPFASFLVRFPVHENPLRISDQHALKAVLVNDGLNDSGKRRIFLWLDVGEFDFAGMPVLTYCQLDCQPGMGIEEAFNRLPHQKVAGLVVPRELQERCLRVVVSVCFLATGADRLIDPEVLSKDLARYLDARERQPDAAERMVEKARRRGKLGWNVGQHERVLHLGRPEKHEAGDGEVRGSLHYQHQRRAHFRLLPTGKVTFVRQATVRPDLPAPERAAGYRVVT